MKAHSVEAVTLEITAQEAHWLYCALTGRDAGLPKEVTEEYHNDLAEVLAHWYTPFGATERWKFAPKPPKPKPRGPILSSPPDGVL